MGAGIVGLGAALAARRAGKSVAVLERDPRAIGASVRNFGHVGVTLQTGQVGEYARRSRDIWEQIAASGGLWLRAQGASIVARSDLELALIEEAHASLEPGRAELRGAAETRAVLESVRDPRVRGSLWLREDMQVDPRRAVAWLADHLESSGVNLWYATHVHHIEPGLVHTNRGKVRAEAVLVAVGDEVERLFPKVVAEHGISKCLLTMIGILRTESPKLPMPLLTASSLLRYRGSGSEIATRVRAELEASHPKLFTLDINEMYTQRPDGMLLVGDTHRTDVLHDPFQPEEEADTVLTLARTIFGSDDMRIAERWQGVYATAAEPYLVANPLPGVRVASVTTGLGMTTGLAFAEAAITGL